MPHASSRSPSKPPRARRAASATHATSADPSEDDETSVDIDTFREELARRIGRFIGNRKGYWRTCPEACCRRARGCVAPHVRCSNVPPSPASDPAALARTIALVRAALERQ